MDKKKQEKIITALLTEPTKRGACKKAGISETMLYHNYLKDPDFLGAYNQAVNDFMESATRELQGAMLTSAKVLRGIVTDETEKTVDRIASARIILDYGLRMTEQVDILKRIERLEGGENE